MNIYVGNLSYSTTEDGLKEVFSPFGEVESATIIKDKFTGNARGFGFVDMPNDDEAKEAIAKLDQTEFEGRNLRVNEAKPPSNDRSSRGPRRDNGGGNGGGRGGRY